MVKLIDYVDRPWFQMSFANVHFSDAIKQMRAKDNVNNDGGHFSDSISHLSQFLNMVDTELDECLVGVAFHFGLGVQFCLQRGERVVIGIARHHFPGWKFILGDDKKEPDIQVGDEKEINRIAQLDFDQRYSEYTKYDVKINVDLFEASKTVSSYLLN